MKISSILLLVLFFNESLTADNICDKIHTDLSVRSAFSLGNFTVIFTDDYEIFRIKQLKYSESSNKFDFTYIEKQEDWFGDNKWLSSIIAFYTVRYLNQYRVMGTTVVKRDGVNIYSLWEIEFNREVTKVVKFKQVYIDPAFYKPGTDPLNFKSLFDKFPLQYLESNIKAIVSLPWNIREDLVSSRIFVYYREKRPRSVETSFKRHIMVARKFKYEGHEETDWKHDENSGNCNKLDDPVFNATITITQYRVHGKGFAFHMIEFFGYYYYLKDVVIRENRVTPIVTLRKDTINQMFGCAGIAVKPEPLVQKPVPESEKIKAPEEPDQPQEPEDNVPIRQLDSTKVITLVIVLVILALISLCMVAILAYIYVQNRTQNENISENLVNL